MRFVRTANAGGILSLDGKEILLDGVCDPSGPYLGTPKPMDWQLSKLPISCIAWTHFHPDHCRKAFYGEMAFTPGVTQLSPENPGLWQAENVTVTPLPSRHLGKSLCPHQSYLITGSQRILFTGDAAPTQWQQLQDVDVLIAPYAYANSPAAWKRVRAMGVKKAVIIHLPPKEKDSFGLWEGVSAVTADEQEIAVYFPEIGEKITL